MADSLQTPLLHLTGAAIAYYAGTHYLWTVFGGHRPGRPLLRGAAMVLPIIIIALTMTCMGESTKAIGILLTGATIILTLSLGLIAAGQPGRTGVASASLRMLAPLMVCSFVIGLSGELQPMHALLLLSLTIVLIWGRPRSPLQIMPTVSYQSPHVSAHHTTLPYEPRIVRPVTFKIPPVILWAVFVGIGSFLMTLAVSKLLVMPILPLIGPVVVPLVILGTIGLLVADTHTQNDVAAIDTVVGGVMTLVGIGLPLVILLATVIFWQSTTETQPQGLVAVRMPMQSWRIDTVALTIVSIMLLWVGLGRFRLSRLDGLLLGLACVVFLLVTVATARV